MQVASAPSLRSLFCCQAQKCKMKEQSWNKIVKQQHSGSDVVPRRSTNQSEPEPLVQPSHASTKPTRTTRSRRCGVKEYVRSYVEALALSPRTRYARGGGGTRKMAMMSHAMQSRLIHSIRFDSRSRPESSSVQM